MNIESILKLTFAIELSIKCVVRTRRLLVERHDATQKLEVQNQIIIWKVNNKYE